MIKLEYTEIDSLLYPNIALDDADTYNNLGKYGRLRLAFLKEQKPQMYRELLLSGKLAQHCADLELSAFEMAEQIRGDYFYKHPAPAEGMERIRAYEHAQSFADETVLHDLIYT